MVTGIPARAAMMLRRLGSAAQRGRVNGGRGLVVGQAAGQRRGLGDAAVRQRVVDGPARQLGGQVRRVLAVPDVPDGDAVLRSHAAKVVVRPECPAGQGAGGGHWAGGSF